MSNLIHFDRSGESAKRLRSLLDRWRAANEEWVSATIDLAAELWAARQLHSSDTAFGHWLVENELDDLGKNDRAALIGMAQNVELSRRILETTRRSSVQHIWEDLIRPSVMPSSVEDSNPPTPEPPKPPSPAVIPGESVSETHEKDQYNPPVKASVSKKSPFYGMHRAGEVLAIYSNNLTRVTLGKAVQQRGGSDLWRLILETLDAGLLEPNTIGIQNRVGLSLLFPRTTRTHSMRYDLSQSKDRAIIRERILPAALANRAAVLANPERLESIVDEHFRREEERKRQERAAQQLVKQLNELPSNQQEVVMYGVRLWPRPAGHFYTYDDLKYGIWTFQDLDRWIDMRSSPASRGQMVRHIVARVHRFAKNYTEGTARERIEGYCGVIRELSRLMAENPNGECRFPSSPKSEDES